MQVIKCKVSYLPPGQCWVGMKATVLSLVSDTLVLNLSSPRPHTTSAIRLEKWIRIFQLYFSSHQPIKINFPFCLLFTNPLLLYDPCSIQAVALYFQFYVLSFFFLMPKSFCLLIGLFNCIIFPVNRQLPEKTERGSKDVPTSHFLAQYFSPNSFLGEFTGGSEVEYAMWRCRWEGSTSGRVSKETARKRNFSYCHSSIYLVEDAPAPSLSTTPLKQQKKGHLAIREVA